MTNINKLPIVDFRNEAEKARDEQVLIEGLVQEGRSARRLGFPDDPPPYRFEDWASHWRDGWRWEDEVIKEERKQR
jgi:hypothetical protein